MASLRRKRDQVTAGFSLLKALPLDTRACTSLLLIADQMLADREGIKDRVEPLLNEALNRERQLTYILRANGPYAELLGGALIRQRNGFRRANRVRSRIQRYAAVDCSFTPDHIPQMPPMVWFGDHLQALDEINLKLLRRAAAIRLVEQCSGGSWIEASKAFDMPRSTTHSTLQTVKRWTANPANRLKFQRVVRALSLHLEGEDELVNYGNRRRRLRDWVISTKEWDELTAGLGLPKRNFRSDWCDTARKAASVLVWERLTLSEYIFAPLFIAERQAHGATNPVAQTVHILRDRRAARHHPYVTFRDRVDTHADQLADALDHSSTTTSQQRHRVHGGPTMARAQGTRSCPRANLCWTVMPWMSLLVALSWSSASWLRWEGRIMPAVDMGREQIGVCVEGVGEVDVMRSGLASTDVVTRLLHGPGKDGYVPRPSGRMWTAARTRGANRCSPWVTRIHTSTDATRRL